MKKIIFTVLSSVAVLGAEAQVQNLYPEFCQYDDWAGYYGGCASVDLNNDGYCDLVIAGFGRKVTNTAGTTDVDRLRMSHVLLIDPKADMLRWKVVNDKKIGFNVTDRPSITPCDINGDGNMDIVAFETTGRNTFDQPYKSGFSKEGIFLGNGDGTLTQMEPIVVDETGLEVGFDMRHFLSGTVCDINSDGRPDIIGIGYQTVGSAKDYPVYNLMLLNQGDGRFQMKNVFPDDEIYHFEGAWVQHYDLNNDGLQDIIISGQSNDNATLGHSTVCMEGDNCPETHFFDIFLNDPQSPGTLRRQYLQDRNRWGQNAVWALGETGCSIGDVDSDGLPDLYLVGYNGDGRKHDIWGLFRSTLRKDGSVEYAVDYSCPIEHARPLNTTANMCGFIDFDGDGNLDYYAPGWYNNYGTQTAFIYTNPYGDGTFTKRFRMGSGSELSSCFVDWNADGVNDLVEMGQSWDGAFFLTGGNHFQATLNPSKTVDRPAAPQLEQPQFSGNRVVLRWQRPDSAKKNVTYEYWIKDSEGRLITGCNAFVGGEMDGRRKVVAPGNACQSHSVALTLADGHYTYGVQTVDASYQGSAFACGEFSVITEDISDVEADSGNGPVYNIAGQRWPSVTKGVNIVGKKKILKK